MQDEINEFPKRDDTRKQYTKLMELSGLEITPDLVCDLADHEREKILYVCVNTKCFSPRKSACGYCSS